MPELPEVETIKQGIIAKLKGKKIAKVEIRAQKLFIGEPKEIIGAKIIDAKRVAKILEIVLDNGYSVIIHLKLTGQLVFQPKDERIECAVGGHMQKAYGQPLPHSHTHIIYNFTDGSRLYFNDLRKFGWNKVVKSSEVQNILGSDKFGPEPGTKEFNLQYLKEMFSRSGKRIKEVLMDQTKVGGLGNIYVNDGLYWAGILPTRPAKSLSWTEISKLKSAIEKVINLGLRYGGSSENTYVNIEGKKGHYMDVTAVYQKKTDPKSHPVKKIQLAGRGTFYCPKCQK